MMVNILSLDPPLENSNEEGDTHKRLDSLIRAGEGFSSHPRLSSAFRLPPEPYFPFNIFVVLPICDGRFRRYIIRLLFGGFSCAAGRSRTCIDEFNDTPSCTSGRSRSERYIPGTTCTTAPVLVRRSRLEPT
ncbi:hypothetical protein PTI98_010153 [Pleurotus ostreatus]|nr:hypothetical protein PTI98_010153 [Pleurotus ostreatus]